MHWAHLVAHRFPDGQLYVNLRGFDPSGQAVDPGEAVRGFLDALGVPPQHLPTGLAAQTGRYRSLLAGRRVLVLIDNAREADQVRPLLPGSASCLVVITSRDQLPGLVATEGARPLTLDLLPVDESQQLLTRQLGKDRVAAEPDAVGQIVTSCAGLPLALAVTAARAATRPGYSLADLATELRAAHARLDAFATGDSATDARAVFSWSYRALSSPAARLFRLLGLHPGPDLSTPAAASLAGLPPPRTAPLLAELCRAHLLTEHLPGRFTFHDLLRAYVAELVHTHDPAPDRHAARLRMFDHYLHTTAAAARRFDPPREQTRLEPPAAGVTPEQLLDSREAALAWFTAEHPVLLSTVTSAATTGFDQHAWQLASRLVGYFFWQGHWQDQAATQLVALSALDRLGNRADQAAAHRDLARAHTQLGRYEPAERHFRQALDLSREAGDRTGEAQTHLNLAWMLGVLGRHPEGLDHAGTALELYRDAGHEPRQAEALNSVGWLHAQVGDYQSALGYCQQALALYQRLGRQQGASGTLDSLGYAYHHLGRHREAIDCYQQALSLTRQRADRLHEAIVLGHLGDTHSVAGDSGAARDHWRQALAILEELDHPDAEQVRTKLVELPPTSA